MKKKIITFTLLLSSTFTFGQVNYASDKEKIQGVITDFMESIKMKDSLKFYSLFHDEPVLWLGIAKEKTYLADLKRNPNVKDYFTSSYKRFFKSISDSNNIYEEKFYNIQIAEDGSIADVSFDYSFWKNNNKQNWGKESWGLIKTGNQWKICSVIFSYEYENIYPQDPEVETNRNNSQLVKQMANELLNIAQLPGLSISIRKKNEIIFAEGFGYADLEKKIPVTANTQFRAASTSKVITVTGLAKMMQDGIIDIEAEVQKYVPHYPLKAYPITLKQLAGNISGMPHYLNTDKLEDKFYSNTKDALSVFSHHPLLFKPQTKYSYSSAGFVLLSAAMEGASGVNFISYLQDKVFNPSGMKSTEPDMGKYKLMPHLTTYYEKKNDAYVAILNPREMSSIWAAGGFVTTPTDLVNMTKAYSNGYLKSNTVRKMFESQTLLSGEKTNVGIGWRIGMDMEGRNIIEHAGVTEGTRSVISYFPDEDIAVSVMTNTEWVSSIEETAHMFVLPFLKNSKSNSKLDGTYPINAQLTQNGKEKAFKGNLYFENGVGKLTLGKDIVYSIIHISGDTYALISNQGIYYSTITINENKVISGRATMYRTPMTETPANIKPFIIFKNE